MKPMTHKQPLAGLKALMTRPAHQAKGLQSLIENLGGCTTLFPTIEICTTQNKTLLDSIRKLNEYDTAIFVSANAVLHSIPLRPNPKPNITTIAIGPGTANALKQFDIPVDYLPEQFNSEGLLELMCLQNIKGKQIIIFCGENSRPLLSETLTRRGAHVTHAICYCRKKPNINIDKQLPILKTSGINFIISSSKESLQNLYGILGNKGQAWLQSIPVLVINQEMVELIRKYQLHQPDILSANATDHAIVDTLLKRARLSCGSFC